MAKNSLEVAALARRSPFDENQRSATTNPLKFPNFHVKVVFTAYYSPHSHNYGPHEMIMHAICCTYKTILFSTVSPSLLRRKKLQKVVFVLIIDRKIDAHPSAFLPSPPEAKQGNNDGLEEEERFLQWTGRKARAGPAVAGQT